MIRKIFASIFVIAGFHSFAQDKGAAPAPEKQIDYKQVGAPMPHIRLVTLDTFKADTGVVKHKRRHRKEQEHTTVTQEYTEKDFDNNASLFVMMFNPTCGHCEDQTEIFKKNIDKLKHSKLVMMANPIMKSYMPDFLRNHKVRDFYPNIYIGIDSAGFIDKTFMYSSLPQITIYDKDRKLVKIYNGEVPMDSLVQFAN